MAFLHPEWIRSAISHATVVAASVSYVGTSLQTRSEGSPSDASIKGPGRGGSSRVGVFLDEASTAALSRRYPTFAGSRFVMLEGKNSIGTGVYEPLYGAVTRCRVTYEMSSHDINALGAEVSMSYGSKTGSRDVIRSIDLPAPILTMAQKTCTQNESQRTLFPAAFDDAETLAKFLVSMGVFQKGQDWCAMVPYPNSENPKKRVKQLLEFKVMHGQCKGNGAREEEQRNKEEQKLSLSGIICPLELYDPGTHSCNWNPDDSVFVAPATHGNKSSSSQAQRQEDEEDSDARNAGGSLKSGAEEEGKDSENEDTCPLCRFLKGGGCSLEFEPFNACVKAAAANDTKADCMHLFGPMVECMTRDEEKKAYYQAFLDDFDHLEKDHADEIQAIRKARQQA